MSGRPMSQGAVERGRDRLTDLLRELDPAGAERICAARRNMPPVASVTVMGATNRGKSSLVNALLAMPGLSPVDAVPNTATRLVFGYAEHPAARAYRPGLPAEPVPVARVAEWTSSALESGGVPPRWVEVDVPVPLLRRLRLVDTPGFGGLGASVDAAGDVVTHADAVLFVVDAAAPLGACELESLDAMGDGQRTVVFALTKIDAFRDWRLVAAANRSLLAEHMPRYASAPLVGVSSRTFELAASARGPGAAAALRRRSGVIDLQVLLQVEACGHADRLARVAELRMLASALDEQRARLERHRKVISAGVTEAGRLAERAAALRAARSGHGRDWRLRLRARLARARVETLHEVARQLRDAQSLCRDAVGSAGRRELARLPLLLDSELARVSVAISMLLSRRLVDAAEELFAEVFTAEEVFALRRRVACGKWAPVVLRPAPPCPSTEEDRLLVFLGLSGGFGAARIAALPAVAAAGVTLANPFVLVPTIAVGLGAGWWMARTRRHAAAKHHVRQWLLDAIGDAKGVVEQLVEQQLISAEQQLSAALDQAIARRIAAIDDQLREVEAARRLRATQRFAHIAGVDERLRAVRAGMREAEELLAGGTEAEYGES